MSKRDKQTWLYEYFLTHGSDNVLNLEFCHAYVEKFYPDTMKSFTGEKDLSRQLSDMCKQGLLVRERFGLSNKQSGSPNWYYEYKLA
ncbi:hypothetical protein GCM10023310_69760 [Paenibacillus vulneris]|uniref:Uncharacterized protein n=1 Tax=Paenibacillus vulneris TaxID=1133364 RepID=A0ABW3UGZ6_9BACL